MHVDILLLNCSRLIGAHDGQLLSGHLEQVVYILMTVLVQHAGELALRLQAAVANKRILELFMSKRDK